MLNKPSRPRASHFCTLFPRLLFFFVLSALMHERPFFLHTFVDMLLIVRRWKGGDLLKGNRETLTACLLKDRQRK